MLLHFEAFLSIFFEPPSHFFTFQPNFLQIFAGVLEKELVSAYSTNKAMLLRLVVLPSILICILCSILTLRNGNINRKLKAYLLSRFVLEQGNWFSFLLLFIWFWPKEQCIESLPCSLIISLSMITVLQNIAMVCLLLVMLREYVQSGLPGLTWKTVLTALALSWTASITVVTWPYFFGYRDISDSGYCEINTHSPFHKLHSHGITTLALYYGGISFVLTFKVCALNDRHNRRSVLLKLAMLFLFISYVRFTSTSLLFSISPDEIEQQIPEYHMMAVSVAVIHRFTGAIPSLLLPITVVVYYTCFFTKKRIFRDPCLRTFAHG